jgi:hypothetical protein
VYILHIYTCTLQRLRSTHAVNYSLIRGKTFYRISEIRRLLTENVIRRSDEHIQDLIKNHRLHVSKDEILKLTDRGLDVFRHYIPSQWRVGRNLLNPLYEEDTIKISSPR